MPTSIREAAQEVLKVGGVSVRYKNGERLSFNSFSVAQQENCLLLGNSGSGKTSLLHAIAGLLPYKGHISIDGTTLSELSSRQLDKFRGKNIGLVFQKAHLLPSLNVWQNLLLAPFAADVPAENHRIKDKVKQLGIADLTKRYPHQLSQGQAQRVCIARAVLNNPKLLLADEPTASLDDTATQQVIELLIEAAQQNEAALLIVTHDKRLKEIIPKQINL